MYKFSETNLYTPTYNIGNPRTLTTQTYTRTYCGLIMQNIALDDASTSFTVKAVPNYYDYPSSFKSSFTHSVTLWNYKSTAKSQGRLIKLVM